MQGEKSGYYVMEAEAGYEPRRRTSYTAMQTGSRGEEASNITIDLTSNRAAIEKFPYDTWAKVMRGILSEKGECIAGYGAFCRGI